MIVGPRFSEHNGLELVAVVLVLVGLALSNSFSTCSCRVRSVSFRGGFLDVDAGIGINGWHAFSCSINTFDGCLLEGRAGSGGGVVDSKERTGTGLSTRIASAIVVAEFMRPKVPSRPGPGPEPSVLPNPKLDVAENEGPSAGKLDFSVIVTLLLIPLVANTDVDVDADVDVPNTVAGWGDALGEIVEGLSMGLSPSFSFSFSFSLSFSLSFSANLCLCNSRSPRRIT